MPPNGQGTPPEQPETNKQLFTLKVVEQDPVTGQTKKVDKQVTLQEALAYAQKGVRFEQKMGAVNAEIETRAAKKAEDLIAGRLSDLDKYLAEIRKTVPEVPALSDEEITKLRDDPRALVAYIQTVSDAKEKKIREDLKHEKELETQSEEEEEQRLAAYDREIKRVMADRPLVSRNRLVDALVARKIPLDQIEAIADEINDELLEQLDLDKLPEDKRKAAIEKYINKTTPPPPPTPGGGETPPPKKFKTIDEIEEEERRKHGW